MMVSVGSKDVGERPNVTVHLIHIRSGALFEIRRCFRRRVVEFAAENVSGGLEPKVRVVRAE